MSRIHESLLFFSLFRYITVAFLTLSALDTSNSLVVQDAQTDILHRLHNEVAQLHKPTSARSVDVLTAIIMYGLSTNWDGSNSPSIFHYNAAVWLYLQTYSDGIRHPGPDSHQEFLLHSLTYWWMGLAFVTDVTQECLLETPAIKAGSNDGGETTNPPKRNPHPLAGVSPEAQRLLGQNDFEAVQRAWILEEEALSLVLPKADTFVETNDLDTPMQDLVNAAEVYQLSALVLLYRAFPDLLNARLRLNEDTSDAAQFANKRRLTWVTALSIHALDILCQNAHRSGTRSIEQILLVIIAGELRKDTSLRISYVTEDGENSTLESPIAEADSPPSGPASSFDHFSAQHVLSSLESLQAASPGSAITKARPTVLERLQAIHEILPYRSVELVQELVLKTWRTSDNDNPEVFWMDIMIENGWKFLMV
ncbi:uncharacterized protein PV07_10903 [Cladophialophora immunda]|uniref:Transcription factor domain-containing protein n=1 Tax=Cladophialophora immunda TaxID=569365 RepID=A0A0D2BU78_9EURO|nr:uncharacterized protein PV07_10903 [Cladophialophora immunda]KIW22623.1 hypothetical protein PV07_10903 [Cladophialophora immunda]